MQRTGRIFRLFAFSMHPRRAFARSKCVKFCAALVLSLFSVLPFSVSAVMAVDSGLSPERMVLLPVGGASREDTEIARWQERARESKATAGSFERLGWAFIAKARKTQDTGFYKLAETAAFAMDARFGVTPESRLLRGHVLHNLHRFSEAEQLARALVAERGLAWDYALLSDILMEQGRIDEAVAACQRSMNLRPGAEAYARAAHFRWLRGDLPGAVEAMTQATMASSPRDGETYAWTLVRLSGYRLQLGQSQEAWQLADKALTLVPEYAPALLAAGRAALARGDRAGAATTLKRAVELNPLPEYRWWFADALRVAGDSAGAESVEAELIRQGEAGDPRTLSLFLASRGLFAERSLSLAQAESAERSDVFTHDALAWALLASGDVAGADKAMQAALAEKTKDARLFFHAGEIARRAGDVARAADHFANAKSMSATLTPSEQAQLAARTGALVSVASKN